ncbi:MAG: 23S rRNA (uracil(1939)-C(5))-methyltransferase RlmD [Streptococcaceae bacterium]|nr:23S rRNA (uracil(1939)-C(5))-methyltransferase RlmD [Streptococcaceae bacterium]
MQKNEVFEAATVVDLTHDGLGVVRVDGFPIFVENALPGETLHFRVTKVGKNFGFGRVEKFLTQSDARVTTSDAALLRTGIADLVHLSVDAQLVFKQRQVAVALSKNAGLRDFPVLETLGAHEKLAYRNKAQIPVRMVAGQLETGFFRKNSHDLIPMTDFMIQAPEIDAVLEFLRAQLRLSGLTAYDERTGRGLVRHLVIRRGHHSGEIMVVFVLSADKLPREIVSALTNAFPAVKSVQINVNKARGNTIFGPIFRTVFGADFITDTLLGKTFQISAPAFYQVNTAQAEKLYKLAYKFAELKPSDIIIDAYSGIGTIGICAADKVSAVYGMEVIPEAVENARANAQLNVMDKCHYEVGKAEVILPRLLSDGIAPDVIFVDPPRKGLDENFIVAAAKMGARSVIYISCNPATFARDVKRFDEHGYRLITAQPVDLFPQTHHVEVVGKLVRKQKK